MRGMKKFNVNMMNIVMAYLNTLLEIYKVVLLFGLSIFMSFLRFDATGLKKPDVILSQNYDPIWHK